MSGMPFGVSRAHPALKLELQAILIDHHKERDQHHDQANACSISCLTFGNRDTIFLRKIGTAYRARSRALTQ